jgi:2-polyprenyl-3-methyl-5-hydroxy-6-metoxy-1,4-benzoquinol methylase
MSSAMASLGRYHEYLWSFVQPWLGQRVLEVGVGFGQYTRRMLAEKRRVLGCDLDTGHLETLRMSSPSPSLETQHLDLEEPETSRAASAAFLPDTVILLNVLEHIRADEKALTFLREVAAPGGRIVVIVPALAVLYNGLDREAGHQRRYSHASLSRALGAAGWAVVTARYINLPGIPGWLVAGWLSRASRSATELNAPSTNWLLRFYDRFFVGLSRLTDPLAARVAGLSVLAVARKA